MGCASTDELWSPDVQNSHLGSGSGLGLGSRRIALKQKIELVFQCELQHLIRAKEIQLWQSDQD